jgi:CheY-like chemotaxis protein
VNKPNLVHIDDHYGSRRKTFQRLMKFKIRDILLVSSLYDNYLFEEDGQLYELIRQEFQVFNLSHPPEITHVTGGNEALELLSSGEHYDLVITTLHIEDMQVIRFAQAVRQTGSDIPIVLLAYDNRERKELVTRYDTSVFDRIFIWQGDYRLLIAIIKCLEDRLNVESDTATAGVQCIILVEDNVNFYSSYLPIIYTEIFNQSQRLVSEGVNLTHKFLRLRARPKILLCATYEEAWSFYERYQEFVLGIISDINFLHHGKKDPEGGVRFAVSVKAQHEDIPILLQSSNPEFDVVAKQIGASFLLKTSPRLLHELRQFMLDNFGFGDFVFTMPDGREVGRATDLKTLEEQIRLVPDESIVFHARKNHFSNWLKARTEFTLAESLRPQRVEEFPTVDDLRNELTSALKSYREMRQRGVITEFRKDSFDPANSFARVGTGSLGGKARGLGFINSLISNYGIRDRFDRVEITVPSGIVIATDVFDRFLSKNRLESLALSGVNDTELNKRFLDAPYFPEDILTQLREFLDLVRSPLAVRSSSLLEDSQYQPFAGVYQTFMIPNNNESAETRLQDLLSGIKLVYASTFARRAKDYMKATAYRLEEEKMAVIVQRMVGSAHGERFYPDFAGVAKSYNFYPVSPQKPTDGIVMVALGLGKTVVEGGNTVRFCPKYPRHLLQFFSTLETVRNSQQEFAALELHGNIGQNGEQAPDHFVRTFDLKTAEEDQTLFYVGSTYSQENDSVYDGISRDGRRIVTFAPILKNKIFPLPEILELILDMGTWGMGTHVEIEFAVNMSVPKEQRREFSLLQIRPLVLSLELEELDVDDVEHDALLVQSQHVLGNGVIGDIHDLIVVDAHGFDRAKSQLVAEEVSRFNTKLLAQKRPYILIGVGRWGSLDRWLGIPVTWDQISGASAIVEAGFKDVNVMPSQGSHFFQNLTSFRIGYFTVSEHIEAGFIDWEWLQKSAAEDELEFTRHLKFDDPITVRINGYKNKGIILKPGRS